MKDWQKRILELQSDEQSYEERERLRHANGRQVVQAFLRDTVVPAFNEVLPFIRGTGRQAEARIDDRPDNTTATFTVHRDNRLELQYEIKFEDYRPVVRTGHSEPHRRDVYTPHHPPLVSPDEPLESVSPERVRDHLIDRFEERVRDRIGPKAD